MALAALIIATREAAGDTTPGTETPTGLVGTLPLLGATLIEYQARQARQAGATHVVLLVERMPAALIAALDRLRRDGIAIDVARAAIDAADRFHPDEAILLIGDGVVADQPLVARIAAARPPALATTGEASGFDRLDAEGWWAGLALVDGATVLQTAQLPGEWDAEATLVRRAVQRGAVRIDAGPPAERPLRASDASALALAGRRLAIQGSGDAPRWLRHRLLAPAARLIARPLAGRAIDAEWIALGATGLALAGGVAALAGGLRIGLGLVLVGSVLDALAERLALVRLGRIRRRRLLARLREAGGAGVLLGAGAAQAAWGWPLLALVTLLAMLALVREETIQIRAGGVVPGWSADPDALAWAALPAVLIGGWPAALAIVAFHAFGSFAIVQDRLLRGSPVSAGAV